MFFAEAQIRVQLYGQPCDMRNYAELIVMRFGSWSTSVGLGSTGRKVRRPPNSTSHNCSLL